MKKKGLSPVIATVLLIALVMIIVVIVFLWARGFLGEQIEKFGKPIEVSCSEIEFEVNLIPGEVGQYSLEIVNKGNIDIYNFEIKKKLGGHTEVEKFAIPVEKTKAVKREVSLFMVEKNELPEKVIIYPSLLGQVRGKGINKGYACLEKGKEINIR